MAAKTPVRYYSALESGTVPQLGEFAVGDFVSAANGGTGLASVTAGSLLIGSGGGFAELLAGGVGEMLKMVGGIPAWGKITNSNLTSGSFANITGVGTLASVTVSGSSSFGGTHSPTAVIDVRNAVAAGIAAYLQTTGAGYGLVIGAAGANSTGIQITQVAGTGYALDIFKSGVGRVFTVDADGNLTTSGVISGNYAGNYLVNSAAAFAQGRIYKDAAYGLVVVPIAGSTYDFVLHDRAGNLALVMDQGTKNLTAAGTFTVGTDLKMSAAVSRLIPGATSFKIRNNADNADNLTVTDAGDLTIRRLFSAPRYCQQYKLTANVTNAVSATPVDIYATGIQVNAGEGWWVEFIVCVDPGLNGGGYKITLTAPTSSTTVFAYAEGNTTAKTAFTIEKIALAQAFAQTWGNYVGVSIVRVAAYVLAGVNAGTINLRIAPVTNGQTMTVNPGSAYNAFAQ